jgi:catechol 2,3-dioxygenase-like lactoylglutathione lyase family enzyme
MEARLSIVTLGVIDLKRARAFYEALGWRVANEAQTDQIVTFNLNGIGFALFPMTELAEDAEVLPEVPAFRGVTLAYNVRTKEEVAPLLAEAERAGGRIIKAAKDTAWGGHSGYFADPDGHLWEVCFNPFSPLADDGSFRW